MIKRQAWVEYFWHSGIPEWSDKWWDQYYKFRAKMAALFYTDYNEWEKYGQNTNGWWLFDETIGWWVD